MVTTIKKAAPKKAAIKKAAAKLDHNDPKFLPIELGLTEKKLAELKAEYDPANIPKALIKGDEDYLFIHERVMSITKVRTAAEATRKQLTSEAVAWQKKVNSTAKDLIAKVEAIEEPWRKAKTDLDEAEKIAAEAARIAAEKREAEVQANVSNIKALAEGLLGASSDTIQERIYELKAIEITDEAFGDYVEAATYHIDAVGQMLESAFAERVAFEEQKAGQEAMAAKLAEQQKIIDDQQAEIDRQAKEKAEADRKAEAAEAARIQKEQDDAAAKVRAEEEAAAKKLADEKAEADRKAGEAALKARLPEDVKLRAFADALDAVDVPDIESNDLINVLDDALDYLTNAIETIRSATQEVK